MISLIIRNLGRNKNRIRPMIFILALSFMLLLLGNSLLEYSNAAFHTAYTEQISGDMSVSAIGESTFSLFGSDALLIGEYIIPPTMDNYDSLKAAVEQLSGTVGTAGVVTSLSRAEFRGRSTDHVLFGVDFLEYAEFFPDLDIIKGSFPPAGRPGILIQQDRFDELVSQFAADNPEDLLGESILLTAAYDNTFTIREVPLTGVIRYPVMDQALQTVALVDVDTARALNGYVYGSTADVLIPESQQRFIDGDIDDLFGEADDIFASPDESSEQSRDLVQDSFYQNEYADETIAAQNPMEGSWNFLLISLHPHASERRVRAGIHQLGYTPEEGYQVRGWRSTVGGIAQLVWFVQLMLNAGLLFVALGAAIITTNALMLSVLERTKEIGTMRALGAVRSKVSIMIGVETIIVVIGAAGLGLLLGGVAGLVINQLDIVLDNQYIHILFGGGPIGSLVTVRLFVIHLCVAAVLAIAAMVYPLKKALSVGPAKAMS